MSEEVIQTRFDYVLGEKSGIQAAQDAKGTIADVRKEIDAIAKQGGVDAIAGGGRALDQANARVNQLEMALADAIKRADDARDKLKGIDEGTDEWRKLTNQILDAEAAAAKFSAEVEGIPGQLTGGAGAGGETIGRADTALSSLAGLAGGLGAAGGGEALMLGSDVLATVEALGELKTTIAAVQVSSIAASGNLGAVGAALGSGVGIAGVAALAGVAVVGLVAAVSGFVSSMNEQAERLNSALEASRTVAEAVGEGLTADEARARLKELQSQLETEQKILAQAEGAYAQLNEGLEELPLGIGGVVGAVTRVFDTREEELASAVDDAGKNVSDLQAQVNQLSRAIEGGAFAEADAAQARQQAAQDLLAAAQEANQAEIERAQLLRTESVDAVNQAIQASQDRIDGINAEIELLKQSGDDSEEIVARVEELNAERDKEIESYQFLTGEVMRAAQANEAAADAEQARQDAIENDARVLEQAVAAHERYETALEKAADAADKATAKAEAQFEKDIARIERQADRSREKEAQSHAKKMADIQKKGNEELADLQAEFATIDFEAADERKKAIEEFNADILELEQERQKEEMRLQQEHDQALLDAVLDRNVQAYILEQRRFEQEQIDRAGEDPVAERRQALQEELAAIDERRQAEIAANYEAIADTRRRIAEQRAAEEEAHKERLEEIAEREEEAKQARREAFEEQKQQIKDNYREQTDAINAAFRDQLTNLQNNLSTETETKNRAYEAQLYSLNSFVQNANAQFAALGGAISAASAVAAMPTTQEIFGNTTTSGLGIPTSVYTGGATTTYNTSSIGTVNVSGASNNAAMEAAATQVFNAAQQDAIKQAAGVI